MTDTTDTTNITLPNNRLIDETSLATRLCRPCEAAPGLLPVPRPAGATKDDGEVVVDRGARRV